MGMMGLGIGIHVLAWRGEDACGHIQCQGKVEAMVVCWAERVFRSSDLWVKLAPMGMLALGFLLLHSFQTFFFLVKTCTWRSVISLLLIYAILN